MCGGGSSWCLTRGQASWCVDLGEGAVADEAKSCLPGMQGTESWYVKTRQQVRLPERMQFVLELAQAPQLARDCGMTGMTAL
jgi:hypothetical protein